MMTITTHEHEGYTFLEVDGGFFKGCRRCGGTGHYSFDGFSSDCYACGNNVSARLGDFISNEIEDARTWCHNKAVARDRRDRRREEQRLAKLARRQVAWNALEAAHPQVWALLAEAADVASYTESREQHVTERDNFVRSIADRLWSLDERPLTEKQIEAMYAVVERRSEQAAYAESHPAPEGRVEVTGEIIGARVKETDYGTQYKITVKDDRGFKVYASIPKAQADEAYDAWLESIEAAGYSWRDYGPTCWFEGTESDNYQGGVRGRRITFTATLTQSDRDASFAFGSRPTRGAWLAEN